MKIVEMKNRIIRAAALMLTAAAVSSFTACKVGLGDEVDLVAPSVSITGPDYMEQVTPQFVITGTCSDDKKVTKLIISCEGANWKWEGNKWQKRDSAQDSWTALSAGEALIVNNDKGGFDFSVNVTLPDTSYSREIIIEATVSDEMGNASKDSIASRSVIYDVTGPVLTITNPVKMYGHRTEIEAAMAAFPDYKNFTQLVQFNNGTLELSGYQEEDYSLAGLEIIICDKNGNEYFNSSDEKNDDIKAQIDENLRNWSVSIPGDRLVIPRTSEPVTQKTFMQVLIHSFDTAGNENSYRDNYDPDNPEENKYDHEAESIGFLSYGWFCWWPQADMPWVEFSNAGTEESPADYYPGNSFQGQCYDDDGIDAVTVNVTGINEVEPAVTSREIGLSNTDVQTFYNWSVDLPSEVGLYEVVARARDINGNVTEWYRGYVNIIDITAPTIDKVNSPSSEEPLFGDEDGNVNFNVTVSDDSGIESAKLVWISEEESLISYLSADYKGWNSPDEKYPENRLYVMTLSDPSSKKNSMGRVEYTASCKLNIFTDLNIESAKELKAQRFVIRVEDANGKSFTKEVVTAGDSSNPIIEFDEITFITAGGSEKIQNINGKNVEKLHGGDSVEITGTWSDDSTDVWGDLSKIGDIELTWNNKRISVTKNDDGTWTTGQITAESGSTVSLIAKIKDLASNEGVAKASFQAGLEAPVLTAVSSTTPDGSYTTGRNIYISMKFNKAVRIEGLNAAENKVPYVTLNNGQTAKYSLGSGTNTHLYVLTVDDDVKHECNSLNVTSVFTSGFEWYSGSEKLIVPDTEEKLAAIGGGNLQDNKDISIIIAPPLVKKAELSADGKKLEITFLHNIEKGKGVLVLEQENVDRVPAVLSVSEYENLIACDSRFSNYYTKGTNGCSTKGTADLTAKYILNYEYDSTNATLVALYKASKVYEVSVDVVSSSVSAAGSVVSVALTDSYALPVKGASYTLTVPEGFVSDVVNNENQLWRASVTLGGVETPVIRVNKSTAGFDSSKMEAQQPLTSSVKIDCQTPASSIYYSTAVKTFGIKDSSAELNLGSSENTSYPQAGAFPEVSQPVTLYTAEIKVGNNSVADLENWQWGAKYAISAQAKTAAGVSEVSCEAAYKSVFVFSDSSVVGSSLIENGTRVWLRGGDNETGTSLTAGFPLSWDPEDKDGIALLTYNSDYGEWYYITWSLNTKAYLTLLAGTVSEESGKAVPSDYYWSVNAWVPFRQFYPLYPGESRIVSSGEYASVWGQERGSFSFTGLDGQGSGGGSGSSGEWDRYVTKGTGEAVGVNSNPGIELLTTRVDCVNTNQKLIIAKNDKVNYADNVIIVQTEASSSDAAEHYVELVTFSYGNKVVIGKASVTPGEAAYITVSKEAAEIWKYNDAYIGGLGVKINSAKILSPVTEVSTTPVGWFAGENTDWLITVKYKKLKGVALGNSYITITKRWDSNAYWTDGVYNGATLIGNKFIVTASDEEQTFTYITTPANFAADFQYNGCLIKGFGIEVTGVTVTDFISE